VFCLLVVPRYAEKIWVSFWILVWFLISPCFYFSCLYDPKWLDFQNFKNNYILRLVYTRFTHVKITSFTLFTWALLPGVLARRTNVCVCHMKMYNTKVSYWKTHSFNNVFDAILSIFESIKYCCQIKRFTL
jgi:hypothetical protein